MSGAAGFDALDPGSEADEFVVNVLVAAVNVVNTVYFGDAIGLEAGEDEGGGGAEV